MVRQGPAIASSHGFSALAVVQVLVEHVGETKPGLHQTLYMKPEEELALLHLFKQILCAGEMP